VIYTSGCLVYPNKPGVFQAETDPVGAVGMLADRVAHEQLVISDPDVTGVVLRPSFVFGKKSGHFVPYFSQAHDTGKVSVSLPDVAWSEIHIDDLVDLYLRVIEAPHSVVKAQIFNAADSSRNTNREIAKAFAAHVGVSVVDDTKAPWEMTNKTALIDCSKARRLLGWVPKQPPLLDQIDLLYNGWKARNPTVAAKALPAKK